MRFITIVFVVFCCGLGNVLAQVGGRGTLPHIVVYKTKKEYRQLVPVQLSDDKKTIVSYPDPMDIKTGSTNGMVFPVLLHKGYFLDRRGISLHTAYIKMTYEQYARLKTTPAPEELLKMIVDKSPIRELCDCGTQGKYTIQQLDSLIDKKQLRKECKVIR